MTGEERRRKILADLRSSDRPVPAHTFASRFGVSRQVIVQDIALLRMGGTEILSGKFGYFIYRQEPISRVFKVIHSDEETKEELLLYVDLGGRVEDVFVFHKFYGILRANLHIHSRHDVEAYMQTVSEGTSTFLKNVTAGYHYHTVTADSEEILDRIQEALSKRGFLARLQDYEPVDFWKDKDRKGTGGQEAPTS